MLTIYPQLDAEEGDYELMCADGRMRPMPCGPRIFRGPPHPVVSFRHATLKEAQADAELIRRYLKDLPERKVSKRELREHAT